MADLPLGAMILEENMSRFFPSPSILAFSLFLSFLSNVDAKKAIKGVPHLGLVNPQIADHRVYEGPLVTKNRTKA